MNILVLGGTGAMGVHLIDLLARRGHTLTVTTRTKRQSKNSITFAVGNAKDPAFINDLLSCHWDAIVDFMVYTTREFTDRSSKLLKSTDHYLYLSSARVYAQCDGLITEDSPRLLDTVTDSKYLSTDEYALTKARQENILFASEHKNWSIVRPYITYSTQRLQLGVLEKEEWLYRVLQGQTLLASMEIGGKFTTLTHGADVASGISALIGHKRALGEAFHITSDFAVQWNEVLRIYLDILENHIGLKPEVKFQRLEDFTRWKINKEQITYDRLYDRRFNNEKINLFIDTSIFATPEQGLRQCLTAFLDGPKNFQTINWRGEAIKDRVTNENIPIGNIRGSKNKLKYLLVRHLGFGHS